MYTSAKINNMYTGGVSLIQVKTSDNDKITHLQRKALVRTGLFVCVIVSRKLMYKVCLFMQDYTEANGNRNPHCMVFNN